MSKVLLYIPRDRVTDTNLWQDIRQWQKASGLNWDKIRCTPASISETDVAKDEMKAALHLIRKGSFEKVVYAELPKNYRANLEWLLFALSCQGQNLSIETLSGPVPLPDSLEQLASGLPTFSEPTPAKPSKVKRSGQLSK